MGKKKYRNNKQQQPEASYNETEEEKAAFAAKLLESMEMNDSEKATSESTTVSASDSTGDKESFQDRHPHLSLIHRKVKKIFTRDDGESEETASDATSDVETSKAQASSEVETKTVPSQKEEPASKAAAELPIETKTANDTQANSASESQKDSNPISNGGSPKGKRRNRRREKIQQRERERIEMIQNATNEAKTEEDKRVVELKGMGMMITKAGLVEHEVQPDGHCLFYSLCDQLKVRKGIETNAQDLRSKLANYIRQHPNDFVPYLLDDETGELQDIEEYTKTLETTPLWGGDLEIAAASRLYECPIKVHFASQMPITVNEDVFSAANTLHLAYYQAKFGLGAHYNSLRDKEETESEAI